MKLVAYDPKMLTIKSGPRMVPGGGERFLGPQGEEVRYSDDQPRDKDGKFASGDAQSPEVVWHGTTASQVDSILKEGVAPRKNGKAYASDDKDEALGWGISRTKSAKETDVALLEIDAKAAGVSSGISNQAGHYTSEGAIPASAIKAVHYYKVDGLSWSNVESAVPHTVKQLRYSPDQPRDDHGRFGEGSGDAGMKEPMEMLNPNQSTHEQKSAMARNAARELNFPTDRVKTDEETHSFNVGNHNFTEAGHAEIYTTGNIVIHTNHTSDDFMRGLVAHEVEHIRFQGVLQDYQNEMEHLRWTTSNDHTLYDAITTPNGYLDPEKGAGAHFPTALALQEFFEKNSVELAKDDGVSAYSRAYWETALDPKYSNGNYPAFRDRAIHETLAEMARMKFTKDTYATGDKPSKLWSGLFKTVNALAKERGYGYNKRTR